MHAYFILEVNEKHPSKIDLEYLLWKNVIQNRINEPKRSKTKIRLSFRKLMFQNNLDRWNVPGKVEFSIFGPKYQRRK